MEEMKNISRINNPKGRTYGYQVRVTRAGVEFSKFFAGLGRESLKRAKSCRDELILTLENLQNEANGKKKKRNSAA
ncbi:MAG: hypothetical protein WCH43_17255 [Verrucomicrobiota bacterium]